MNFALVCADGIGDALIFSIFAHNLRKQGHLVTVFSPHIESFGNLLEKGNYRPMFDDWEKALAPFDAVILQYDTTERSKTIKALRDKGLCLYIFYTNYHVSKHGDLLEQDYAVDATKPMVTNVILAIEQLFGFPPSKQNCLLPKLPTVHRKYKKRILIHPMSTQLAKNWPKKRFLKLARQLEKRGFDPMFILSKEERSLLPKKLNAPHFPSLEDLAFTVYESGFIIGNDSGLVHLGSYYKIPHITLCQGRQMPLWASGWLGSCILYPSKRVPNIKFMRLREKHWPYFISTGKVLKSFFEKMAVFY